MRLLFFGTILKPSAFAYDAAANPASTKWLSGLVAALVDLGHEVTLCGHCYMRAWPKGRLMPGRHEYLDSRFNTRLVRYVNVPGIRFPSLGRGYYLAAKEASLGTAFDAIVTYNPYPWHVSAALKIKAEVGLPWISLNLDFDDVGPDWSFFRQATTGADAHLFLSHWGYEMAPVERKLHLDGGISVPPESPTRDPNKTLHVVYLGKLGKSGGRDILLGLPSCLKNMDVRFTYGGKASGADLEAYRKLAEEDPRVDFRGFVADDEVQALFQEADVFINPRDPDAKLNDMVFPSKIHHYLGAGKPIISTWTRGLSPEYRDLLTVSKDATAEGFAEAVKGFINEKPEAMESHRVRIRDFVKNGHTWEHQARRFAEFISKPIALESEASNHE